MNVKKPCPDRLFQEYQRTGSTRALERVIDLLGPELLLVGRRFATDASAAEDLVQDTFIRAMEAAAQYDHTQPLRPWLITILRNRARRLARRRELSSPAPSTSGEPPDPHQLVEQRELVRELERALDKMPEQYGQVLRLHLLHGLSLVEIARALDRAHGTVKAQHHRGMEKLRQALPRGLTVSAILAVCAGNGMANVRRRVLGVRERSAIGTGVRAAAILLLAGIATVFAWGSTWMPGQPKGPGAPPPVEALEARRLVDPVAAAPREERLAIERPGSVRVRLRWRDHGEPAAGISLRLNARYSPGTHVLQASYPTWLEQVSDRDGIVAFENVPPGRACLFLDDGLERGSDFFVRPDGGSIEITLDLAPKHDVVGFVVDAQGNPAAEAEVWLSTSGTAGSPGFVAALTGPDGAFRVRHFHAVGHLWARKIGHCVSTRRMLTRREREEQVRLVLGADPCSVSGRVHGIDGAPVAGAVVGVYEARWRPQGRPVTYRLTGRDGGFAVQDLPEGEYQVIARVAELAPSIPTGVRVAPGRPGQVTLRLREGAVVSGRLLWNRSVGHERLRVLCRPLEFQRPDLGGLLGCTSAVDRRGQYRLEGLPEGPTYLFAIDRLAGHQALASTADLLVAAGGRYQWNLAQDATLELRGRVLDERGAPLAGVQVHALLEDVPDWTQRRTAPTNSDGRFVLPGLQALAYRLHFVADGHDGGVPWVTMTGVFPQDAELAVTLASRQRPTAFVHGSLSPRAASRWRNVYLLGDALPTGLKTPVDPDSGNFRFGPLPPGSYSVVSHPSGPDEPGCTLATTEVAAGSEVELPALDPGERQRVTIRLEHADGRPVSLRHAILFLSERGQVYTAIHSLEDGAAEVRLFPGEYVALVRGGSFRTHRESFTVEPGRPGTIHIRVAPARLCQLRFPFANGSGSDAGGLGKLLVTVHDRLGQVVFRDQALPKKGFHYDTEIGLPEGRYTVKAWPVWGGHGVKTFDVPSVDGPAIQIPVELR